jgi:hypothetical protein
MNFPVAAKLGIGFFLKASRQQNNNLSRGLFEGF